MLGNLQSMVLTHVGLEELNHLLMLKKSSMLIAIVDRAVIYANFLQHKSVTMDHVICAILRQLDDENNFWLSDDFSSEPCREAILQSLNEKQYLKWIAQRKEPKGRTTYASIAVFDFVYEVKTDVHSENFTLTLLEKILEKSYSFDFPETPELFSHFFHKEKMLKLIKEKLSPNSENLQQQETYQVVNSNQNVADEVENNMSVQGYLEEISNFISSYGISINFTKKAVDFIDEQCNKPVEVLTRTLLKLISDSLDLDNRKGGKVTHVTVSVKDGDLKTTRKSRTIL